MDLVVLYHQECKEWKQNIELGKRNNQNFVSVPHAIFINQPKYKAELFGIEVIITEKSYTIRKPSKKSKRGNYL